MITNNPIERSTLTYPWAYWDNGFTPDEIKRMCNYFTQQGVKTAGIAGKSSTLSNKNIRTSDVRFYDYDDNNNQTKWIFERLNYIIEQINNQLYGFELNGFSFFQYTEYQGSENARYDYHTDMLYGENKPSDRPETRKLSLTLCLNEQGIDYEGGEFQINLGDVNQPNTVDVTTGRAILFPSWVIHRVAPVTKGVRKSLVVWVEGPKFK